jgi:fatty acid desaturase
VAIVGGILAILALYRAGSFIHELSTSSRTRSRVSGWVWNLIVGIPLLVPSFMYEGVHNQHHAKRYYGTANDP